MKKLFVLFLILASCKKLEVPEEREPVGVGVPNAFVLETRYISHNGNELYLQMDIGVVNRGTATDDLTIGDTAFKNAILNTSQLTVLGVNKVQLNQNENYSTLILMDVCSDWSGNTDNFNLRMRAMNKAIIETKENPLNEIGLASYANDGTSAEIVTPWTWDGGEVYNQSYEDLAKIAFYISTLASGTNSYYAAIDSMLNFVNTHSAHPNRSITVINLGFPDPPNTTTALITKANSLNIKVNCIFLTDPPFVSSSRLALETGGFLNVISNTSLTSLTIGDIMDKGTPMIGSIARILSKNMNVYRVDIKLIKNSGSWTSGTKVFENYEMSERLSDGSLYVNNYIPIYVQIP